MLNLITSSIDTKGLMNYYIATHDGLGDHILCNGLYRHFASVSESVYVPCRRTYYHSIRRMLQDLSNVRVVPYSDLLVAPMIRSHRQYLVARGYQSINLGIFGEAFYTDTSIRYDQKFYEQAKIPFDLRWTNFHFPRNSYLEDRLYENLVGSTDEYIFLHEDQSRGFTIDRTLLPKNITIIEPVFFARYGNFFNYTKILKRAREIHCIESSFAALIESLNLDVPKFAHRYARPEAKSSYFHEFTYRSNWIILN